MNEVKIETRSLFPNSRTKVMIGRHDYANRIEALIFIMQAEKPNTLITISHPTDFDLVAAIKEEIKAKDAKAFSGKIVETIASVLDGTNTKKH